MPTLTNVDGRSTTQPGRPSPETSKNLAHFSKAVLAPRWRLLKSGRFFFFKFGVSETWSIQHPKFNSSKIPHFWRGKNWHVRQHRQLATRFQDLRRLKNHVCPWRAFVACQNKESRSMKIKKFNWTSKSDTRRIRQDIHFWDEFQDHADSHTLSKVRHIFQHNQVLDWT